MTSKTPRELKEQYGIQVIRTQDDANKLFVYPNDRVSIVYFYGDQCGWCKKFSPNFYEFVSQLRKEVPSEYQPAIYMADGSGTGQILQKLRYNVQGVPEVVVVDCVTGNVQRLSSGLVSVQTLRSNLSNILARWEAVTKRSGGADRKQPEPCRRHSISTRKPSKRHQ